MAWNEYPLGIFEQVLTWVQTYQKSTQPTCSFIVWIENSGEGRGGGTELSVPRRKFFLPPATPRHTLYFLCFVIIIRILEPNSWGKISFCLHHRKLVWATNWIHFILRWHLACSLAEIDPDTPESLHLTEHWLPSHRETFQQGKAPLRSWDCNRVNCCQKRSANDRPVKTQLWCSVKIL